MNKREKVLAGLVGFLVVALGLMYFGNSFIQEAGKLDKDIEMAKRTRVEQDGDIAVGERSTLLLQEMSERALPWDRDEARKLLTEEDIAANKEGIGRSFSRFLGFGDGPTDAFMVVTLPPGSYRAAVTVTDDAGLTDSADRGLSIH